jgi:hypothetical protein
LSRACIPTPSAVSPTRFPPSSLITSRDALCRDGSKVSAANGHYWYSHTRLQVTKHHQTPRHPHYRLTGTRGCAARTLRVLTGLRAASPTPFPPSSRRCLRCRCGIGTLRRPTRTALRTRRTSSTRSTARHLQAASRVAPPVRARQVLAKPRPCRASQGARLDWAGRVWGIRRVPWSIEDACSLPRRCGGVLLSASSGRSKVAFGNDCSSASAAIPPCVVPVCSELVSCRSALYRFERPLFDRANVNSGRKAELRCTLSPQEPRFTDSVMRCLRKA